MDILIKFHQKLQRQYILDRMCECFFTGLCCCCSCCFQSCYNALLASLGKQKLAKFLYLLLVIVFTIPAILIMFFINKWRSFREYFSWLSCPQSSGGNFQCIGPETVFRISLSFLALFLIMLVFMLCRNKLSEIINQNLFFFKYLLVLGLFIGFLFINSKPFRDYAEASKYISIIYMIIQSIVLIDLFFLAGIKLVKRYDEGNQCFASALVFLTIIFQSLAIGANIYGYIRFSSTDNCGNSLWVNIITSIILIGLPFLQILNFNKQNSLLTTSMVSLYVSYLALICQYSYGGKTTCTDRMTISSIAIDIAISTFFFILTTYGTIMGGSGQMKVNKDTDLNQAIGVAPVEKNPSDQELYKQQKRPAQSQIQTQETNVLKYSQSWLWTKWHFFMCLASIYVGMLITNWTSASLITGELISNDFGFWVRVSISWVTTLVYLWTLVAPRIFPDRDFTVV